ncbi:glycosyltransferase family 4 protein [Microvirga sp. BT688]|uniref:glycosyltransferase family 4 protein n=1 Tax=Microvirga sp. TaxID=1873136 RepID=UPI0016848979|nr:glycosyltransferase family 4 protein [Microvirga sp.]MBD2746707.1 glycosyltransferase family 4 protein [Microvirga sp.]
MTQNNDFDIKRFWVREGDHPIIRHGYLDNPENEVAAYFGQAPKTLDDLSQLPCLFLLGLPGMGKTEELRRAAERATARNENAQLIALGRIRSAEELASAILSSPNYAAWRGNAQPWSIFLDGLDEALARESQIQDSLLGALKALQTEVPDLRNLRLRISCRSAEWPKQLEIQLGQIWNEETATYFLAPLREVDVEEAARVLLPQNVDEFLQQIRRYEVQALAARPITLLMLLNIFVHDGELPQFQAHLYRKGLLATIEEANKLRRTSLQTGRLDNQSKLMIAARIAASTVFSGSTQVWTGLQAEIAPPRAVVLSEITGGSEIALGSRFHVGEAEIYEVILSHIFTPVENDTYIWTHQTFSEFLAAYYLVEHGLTAEQIARFFFSDPAGPVPPQLREVAAWTATLSPDFFRLLLDKDPTILLRSDVASAGPADRLRLVQELLDRLCRGELLDEDTEHPLRYDRLNHPGLSQQLGSVLENRDNPILAQRIAIQIAIENAVVDLIPLLVRLALDPKVEIFIRSRAARAVARIGAPEDAVALRPILDQEQSNDIEDELKGAVLEALWPTSISFKELLSHITPRKKQSFFGNYWRFLFQFDPGALSERDIGSVIEWLLRYSTNADAIEYERVAPKLLLAAWRSADTSKSIGQFVQIIAKCFDSPYSFFRQTDLNDFIREYRNETNKEKRTFLVRAILDCAIRGDTEVSSIELIAMVPWPIVSQDDLPWLIDELKAGDGAVQGLLAPLIAKLTQNGDLNPFEYIWEAAVSSRDLSSALRKAHSIDLDSPIARWRRDEYTSEQEAKRSDKEVPKLESLIEQLLQKIETGKALDWWQLDSLLLRWEGDRRTVRDYVGHLGSTASWHSLPDHQKLRTIKTAQRFLQEALIKSRPWFGSANEIFRPAQSAYRAFRLLRAEAPDIYAELEPRVWSKWIPALLNFRSNDGGEEHHIWQQIILDAYQHAPDRVILALKRIITSDQSDSVIRRTLEAVDECYDQRLGDLLWSRISLDKSTESELEIVSLLVRKGYEPAVQASLSVLDQETETTEASQKARVGGLANLLTSDPQRVIPQLLERRDTHSETVRAVWARYASLGCDDHAALLNIEESDLGRVYKYLDESFPMPERDEESLVHSYTISDEIDDIRNAIIKRLTEAGTLAAVRTLEQIASNIPKLGGLRWSAHLARRNLSEKQWQARTPAEIIQMVSAVGVNPGLRSEIQTTRAAVAEAEAPILQSRGQDGDANETELSVDLSIQVSDPTNLPPLKLLFVGTEWRSGHGGISTLNRELCNALAQLGHQVFCLLVSCSDADIKDAKKMGVTLITAPDDPIGSDTERLLLVTKSALGDLEPDAVVGHDNKTGFAGRHIASRVLDEVPYIHFLHTLPEEIEPFKTRVDRGVFGGADRAKMQDWLCQRSELVVAVGPRIERVAGMRLALTGKTVARFVPGLSTRLVDFNHDLSRPRINQCLLFGRLEDYKLKGVGMACEIIRKANDSWRGAAANRPSLILRGLDRSTRAEEVRAIAESAGIERHVTYRPYTDNADDIEQDITQTSVVLMPSEFEAFGLAALEAISAGVPVILTATSGLAELLVEYEGLIGRSALEAITAEVGDADGPQCSEWAERVSIIFSDLNAAFARAHQIRERLKSVMTWDASARKLAQDISQVVQGSKD